ncbi:MAG: Trk system potassium transporter TrkA [Acutalibacteraceae bacterium]|nr:Trk system potassium transporter TrkA [Acutalibacteraceae bacterium]
MNIIVVGIGKVGYTVAEQLSAEMHDVTVIDTNENVLSDTIEELDVRGVHGNGASRKVLIEAGISECDLLIALTGGDETNLLCCLLANKLGANGTIARVRNPEYNEDIRLIKDSLGLTMAVNPEKEAAEEIFRILRFPSAKNVDIFAKGKVDLVSFVANSKCNLCGNAIKDIFGKVRAKALICAIERGNEIIIPNGDTVVQENDTIALLAEPREISPFFKEVGIPVTGVKDVMLIGGGKLAHYLAVELIRHNINTTIIEKNQQTAENLSFMLPDANVICGDGTNRSLLIEEGLLDVDAVCCLTGIDEENILLSLYAKSVTPETKTITKVNKISFQEVIRSLDLGSVIYPKYITANLILQHVRARKNNIGNNIETLYKIIDNKVEALEFHVSEDSLLLGKTLEELTFKNNVIVGCITRKGNVFIPHGKDTFKVGDSVIIVTTISGLSDLDDIIKE